MKLQSLTAIFLSGIWLSGCALLNIFGGGEPKNGPKVELKGIQERIAKLDTDYYQDKNGLNPNLRSHYGEARKELADLYNINETPMRSAQFNRIFYTRCNKTTYGDKKEWTNDKEGAAKYYAALPALVTDVVNRHANWAGFFYSIRRQNKGNSTGYDAIKGTLDYRRKDFDKYAFKSGLLKDLMKKIGKCPHAPANLTGEMHAIIDKGFAAQMPKVNQFLDFRLAERLKGKKMPANTRGIARGAQKKLTKIVRNWLGEKYNIKSVRFTDSWTRRDEWVRTRNGLKHVKEDFTHMLMYIDPGEGRPFYDCKVLDGVRDHKQGKKLFARWVRGSYSCSPVNK